MRMLRMKGGGAKLRSTPLGLFGVAVVLIVHHILAVQAFLPHYQRFPHRHRLVCLGATRQVKNDNFVIQYSPNFHRHVVMDEKKGSVQESFLWLDEAKTKYPRAKMACICTSKAKFGSDDVDYNHDTHTSPSRKKLAVVELTTEDEIVRTFPSVRMAAADVNTTERNMYNYIHTDRIYKGKRYMYEMDLEDRIRIANKRPAPIIAGGGLEEASAFNLTTDPNEWTYLAASNASLETLKKYRNVIGNLNSMLSLGSSSFFDHFPKSDHGWIQERILFFLSPPPESYDQEDWVRAFCVEGYGVGMTESQTVTAILALRHLLQLYPHDSSSGKPSLPYFYQQLKVTFPMVDKTRAELGQWISGSCAADLMTFAFLHSIDVSWDQCKIISQALSNSIICTELEPNLKLRHIKQKQLDEEALHYLRMRLHLSPAELLDMLRTHSRLSFYSKDFIKLHLDAIQSKLDLPSSELRSLVFRSPSVLGISIEKLDQRVLFLAEEVNMTKEQIQKSVLSLPSLLSYSVESNLIPKVNYFKNELGISPANLTAMVLANPSLMGRSLNKSLIPTVEGLRQDSGLSMTDVRMMIVHVPQILTINWKTNLKPKLVYLKERLGLSKASLRTLLKTCPRLCVHGISTSLEPKLKMLEEAAGDFKSVTKVVLDNPSLLLSNRAMLDRRISTFQKSNFAFVETFSKDSKVPEKRRKKNVFELSEDGKVIQMLLSVEDAALQASTSKFNMYNIIKTGRLFQGKRYAYGSNLKAEKKEGRNGKKKTRPKNRTLEIEKRKKSFLQDLRVNYVPEESSMRLSEVIQTRSCFRDTSLQRELKEKQNYLAAFVSSQVYPRKEQQQEQSAGGHCIYVPQLHGAHTGGELLRGAAKCLPNLMPCEVDGTSFTDGLMLLGYPYERPSKRRCTMYACRDALRLILQLLLNNPDSEFKNSTVHIDLFTDNNYVFQMLHNETNLLRWGSYDNKENFVFDGEMPECYANKDILYPLSRTYFRLAKQDFVMSRGNITIIPNPVASEIRVRIRHKSEVGWDLEEDSKLHFLGDYAEKAASWQFERSNTFVPKLFVRS